MKNQLKEYQTDNRIQDLQRQKEELESSLDNESNKNRKLKQTVNENRLYKELSKIQMERDKLINENGGLEKVLSSKEFQNSDAAYQEALKQKFIEDYKKQLLLKRIEFQKQQLDLEARKSSIPNQDDINKIHSEYDSDIQKQIADNYNLEKEVYDKEAPIRSYNAKKQNLKDFKMNIYNYNLNSLKLLLNQINYNLEFIMEKLKENKENLK